MDDNNIDVCIMNNPCLKKKYYGCDAIIQRPEGCRLVKLLMAPSLAPKVKKDNFYIMINPVVKAREEDCEIGSILMHGNAKVLQRPSFAIPDELKESFFDAQTVSIADASASPRKKRRLSIEGVVKNVEEKQSQRVLTLSATDSSKEIEVQEWLKDGKKLLTCEENTRVKIRNLETHIWGEKVSLVTTTETEVVENASKKILKNSKIRGANYDDETDVTTVLIGKELYTYKGLISFDEVVKPEKDVDVYLKGNEIERFEVAHSEKDIQAKNI